MAKCAAAAPVTATVWVTQAPSVWSKGWRLRYWLAPLEQTCEELREAGFLIERLLEPRPVPEAADLRPEGYARLHREPTGFLTIRALARPHRAGTPS